MEIKIINKYGEHTAVKGNTYLGIFADDEFALLRLDDSQIIGETLGTLKDGDKLFINGYLVGETLKEEGK
jgi:hypothetical protein